ncbi:MAG: dTDP-glucose 4,6-dehydratase [Nitrospina sp.]|jgi:dTDP-glucose 4,6-dehydratase|nr:dTDP-glucose 4,6-dehydratase [Nitrospina sp.]MBT3855649.1 dTDP-glucose 4,6-dehydratase [Nitrospina sp.]MBT4104481.1 dTDP-glucose 4,6-dehydratase [Nitrospina sp.]MBT4390366.1 dTDP-glucose 4,6-dehydratase [Nitrospina sp.]MBT4619716.1 dTDP-glucose 4,6-dehydratase [Nitrospina sp.]
MKTFFVTGGAGFIGGNFILNLMKTGQTKVVNYDKLTYAGNLDTLSSVEDDPNYFFEQGDICNRDKLRSVFLAHDIDAVVHFAAESHVDRSIESPGDFIQTNVVGTYELLETTRGYWRGLSKTRQENFRFLHVSTDEVYGSLGETGLFTEETPYAPNSPYAASKASSDHLVRSYHKTFGLPVLTTNCSNNYGPYQFPEKLLPLMIQKALEGEPLPIYGDGKQIRDWLYVEDHCRAILEVLEKGTVGQVYNIGGHNEKSNLEVVHALCNILDEMVPGSLHRPHESLISFVEDRPGHDRRYAIDASKIQNQLGWKPQESFETGLRKTVSWYLNNKTWTDRVLSGAYQGERLGLEKH